MEDEDGDDGGGGRAFCIYASQELDGAEGGATQERDRRDDFKLKERNPNGTENMTPCLNVYLHTSSSPKTIGPLHLY